MAGKGVGLLFVRPSFDGWPTSMSLVVERVLCAGNVVFDIYSLFNVRCRQSVVQELRYLIWLARLLDLSQ